MFRRHSARKTLSNQRANLESYDARDVFIKFFTIVIQIAIDDLTEIISKLISFYLLPDGLHLLPDGLHNEKNTRHMYCLAKNK